MPELRVAAVMMGPAKASRSATAIPIADIHTAAGRLRGVCRHTPLHHSYWLTERFGVPVYLKLECWQRTNSFKLRGAYNAVASLDGATRVRGLITASAGNHGQAVALAARLHGVTATIFVPESAPATKQARIRAYGADLRLVAGTYDDAAAAAVSWASDAGAHYVHAFSDASVVAGQGTVGLEIVQDLPGVTEVVVPVGGGGLAAGVGTAVKSAAGPAARVTGVQSTETRAMHAAFEASRVVPTPVVPTLCDGLAGEVEATSYERAREVLDTIHLVPEAAVSHAIRELYRHEGVIAEGAGAVGVAALLTGRILPSGPTAVVVSGGNIDMSRLAHIFRDE
jgi:threonine dehydratase